MIPKLSGNYLLKIYDDDLEDPAFQIRIMVIESVLELSAIVNYARNTSDYSSHHQIDAQVNIKNFPITDIATQCKLGIMQNNRQDQFLLINRPMFDDEVLLRYENNSQSFEAGNQFRDFDIRTLQTLGRNVTNILQSDTTYEIFIEKDESRSTQAFTNTTDINGQYVIGLYQNILPNTEAEYCQVHFELDVNTPFKGGKIYVLGEFNFFEIDPLYEMKFDYSLFKYVSKIFLKQGYYNYIYVFVPDKNKSKHDSSLLEGNFKDTENEYQLFFYYRDFNGRYDRIIGYNNISSNWR